MATPIYTADNCKVSYQLNWSLSIFANSAIPDHAMWLLMLKDSVEQDGVRILEYRAIDDTIHQFLLSTKPHVSPSEIIRSVKGRLQHFIGSRIPKAFRRNYRIHSIGSARREVVEQYVRSQLNRHKMADERVQQRLAEYQIHNPGADLSKVRRSSHGEFILNLHLVFVHVERWNEVSEEALQKQYAMIGGASERKGHLLSEAGILSDHVHLAVGCGIEESPTEVALGYMNNLAFAHGMQRIFQFGFHVGTFGEYDLGAIRNALSV